jgi:hypothetical protein
MPEMRKDGKIIVSAAEVAEKLAERSALAARVAELDAECLKIKAGARKVLARGGRPGYSRRFDEVRQELMDVRARLSEIKTWLQTHDKAYTPKPSPPNGASDPYAINNALSEPLMLLRVAHGRLKRLFRLSSFLDGDRALMDQIGDYLFRMGTFTDRRGGPD